MAYNHAKVDLSVIPDCELKETFIHLAEQHNALVDGANEMKQDLDQVSGVTPQEKVETSKILGLCRGVFRYIHSKRFLLNLLTMEVGLLIFILKNLGLTLTPDQSRQIMGALIQILQKLASQ